MATDVKPDPKKLDEWLHKACSLTKSTGFHKCPKDGAASATASAAPAPAEKASGPGNKHAQKRSPPAKATKK
jgi:hypothetical protein